MGLDAAVPTHVTNEPAHDARPSSLHRRLTVALASASDRAQLAALIAGDLGSVGAEQGPHLLRSEDLWQAADGFARDREADRQAERSKRGALAARSTHDFDTARLQLDHLVGRRGALIEGAEWASGLQDELAAREAALAAAAEALDLAQHDRRTAQQDVERVLEQRAAAASAIEEADRELAEMAGSGMDETALRRELEAAGDAVQQARDAHDHALARLEELQIEATGLSVRREALGPPVAVADEVDLDVVRAVHEALGSVRGVRIDGEIDRDAVALAEAWTAVADDLRAITPAGAGGDDALAAAERRFAAATDALQAHDEASAASTLAPEDRAAIDAAHAELLEAEEVVTRRRVTGAAKRRLDQARDAERGLLDQHGFGSYLDVVLTGGRSVASDPGREVAEREHFEAKLAVEALRRSAPSSPDAVRLRAERDRLLDKISDLLGVDPGDAVVDLLRSHRPVSSMLQAELRDALALAGIRPVGVSLEAAAESFLSVHPLPDDDDLDLIDAATHGDPSRVELAAIEARTAALEGELATAEAEVDRTAEALQMAERSVGAFESELTVRAGEDLSRLQRFAAAEQLRAQIEAVASTLRRAEESARTDLAEVERSVGAAEAAFDQASADLSDLARRARQLAEELPIDQRPEGEVLGSLDVLAERLRGHADVIQPELDQAEVALAAATRRMDEALDAAQALGPKGAGPIAEDLADGLADLLAVEPQGAVLLLDEPFVGVDSGVRGQLLEQVREASAGRQLVLLTADADVLGWAIELPAEEAAALPADALLARLRRTNQDRPDSAPATPAPTESARPGRPAEVDITAPALEPMAPTDTKSEPAKTGRRWAGQR